jgi:hypothetical protein
MRRTSTTWADPRQSMLQQWPAPNEADQALLSNAQQSTLLQHAAGGSEEGCGWPGGGQHETVSQVGKPGSLTAHGKSKEVRFVRWGWRESNPHRPSQVVLAN